MTQPPWRERQEDMGGVTEGVDEVEGRGEREGVGCCVIEGVALEVGVNDDAREGELEGVALEVGVNDDVGVSVRVGDMEDVALEVGVTVDVTVRVSLQVGVGVTVGVTLPRQALTLVAPMLGFSVPAGQAVQ